MRHSSSGRSDLSRHIRVAALLTATMVLNELGFSFLRFRSILGSTVLDEVSINLGLLRGIFLEGLLMVLAAALCALVMCAAWSSISLVRARAAVDRARIGGWKDAAGSGAT